MREQELRVAIGLIKKTASDMAAEAARETLKDANLDLSDIDLIVAANGVVEQLIPYNASLLHKKLKGLQPLISIQHVLAL